MGVHNEADLTGVAKLLFGDARYVPTVEELQGAINKLSTENQRQCFIRVMRLHLPGVQRRATFAELAAERGGSKSAVRVAFGHASYEVEKRLRGARNKALHRGNFNDDLTNKVE